MRQPSRAAAPDVKRGSPVVGWAAIPSRRPRGGPVIAMATARDLAAIVPVPHVVQRRAWKAGLVLLHDFGAQLLPDERRTASDVLAAGPDRLNWRDVWAVLRLFGRRVAVWRPPCRGSADAGNYRYKLKRHRPVVGYLAGQPSGLR